MRTTLTLDDDIAVRLERLRRDGRRPFRAVVNDALRAGLDALEAPKARRRTSRTPSVSLGGSLVGDIGNVHEVLSIVEGDDRR